MKSLIIVLVRFKRFSKGMSFISNLTQTSIWSMFRKRKIFARNQLTNEFLIEKIQSKREL